MVFNLSTMDCFTNEERALYNSWKKAKEQDKDNMKNLFLKKLGEFSGIRKIEQTVTHKDGTPKLWKMIARFEDQCARLSESFVFEEDDPKHIPFIPEIVIMDCHNESILNQIIENGVMIDNKKYVFYSSSANQQKNKQVCLLEEIFYKKHYNKLMCGLNTEKINSCGGCNAGKYLAYTSLIFSKSEATPISIDIEEVLILPEFETKITERVNYLDIMDENIMEEREMSVPVNHMDGAGMFLPGVLEGSAQIRGGWIKGAVFPFDFQTFILEKRKEGKVLDSVKNVWGEDVPIDHIINNVKLILNGSQIKMWKYYDSWEEYKQAFKETEQKLYINNSLHYPETDNPITPAAYQFFQTIPRENFTEERIENLCRMSVEKIIDAKTNEDTALQIMGVDTSDENVKLDAMKACLKIYPQMLQDVHVRKRIANYIGSLRKSAMGGKVLISGFYNYICPDLYAACEHWFCGEEKPKGLIPSNHVYNRFYDDKDISEACCLRSPHLSDCEHGIRKLVKSDECKRWFSGMDTVISTHDLLTKTLQCDVDGDEMLITHDRAFIDLVDRNKLPLYYDMKKAEPTVINCESIKQCLKCSFENSVIGLISNSLTKHLNGDNEPDLRFVRFMTAYNNFCIDFPKSQYMPALPNNYQELFEALQADKFPCFFKYAKDKKKKHCSDNMLSNVDCVSKYVQRKTSDNKNNVWNQMGNTKEYNPGMYKSKAIQVDRNSELYEQLYKALARLKKEDTNSFKRKLNDKCKDEKYLGYDVFYHYCSGELLKICGVRKKLTTYLVDIEYSQPAFTKTTKEILWNCFGDVIYENLCVNLQNPEDAPKIIRMAYQKKADKELKNGEKVKQAKEELQKEYVVPIHKAEFEWIKNTQHRKNSKWDFHLMFILYVLYKRKLKYYESNNIDLSDEKKRYLEIYKNIRKKNKTTLKTIDKWIEHDVAKKGLSRLEKNAYIKLKNMDKKYTVLFKDIPLDTDKSEILFSVYNKNPLIDYYKYSGEKSVKQCVICGRDFVADKNEKTCSDGCSRNLELMNKNIA